MSAKNEFVAEMQGDFLRRTDLEIRADEAVSEYDTACESYDRLICGEDGKPKTGYQHHLVNKNARETRDWLIGEYRITADEFQKAIIRSRREKR